MEKGKVQDSAQATVDQTDTQVGNVRVQEVATDIPQELMVKGIPRDLVLTGILQVAVVTADTLQAEDVTRQAPVDDIRQAAAAATG